MPFANKAASEPEMWNELNIDYEKAYGDNALKKTAVRETIKLLSPGSRVLDVGCGTGVPVGQMLADAGMDVVGTDISPNMIWHAQQRVRGAFEIADMRDYEPPGPFDAVLVIFSQLGLSYQDFATAAFRFARALNPNGLMVIGQAHADPIVPDDDPAWGPTKRYVEGYNLPFMGEDFPTLMFTRQGQRDFVESMGMDVVFEMVDLFHPDDPRCAPEWQQYVVGRRKEDREVKRPVVGGR